MLRFWNSRAFSAGFVSMKPLAVRDERGPPALLCVLRLELVATMPAAGGFGGTGVLFCLQRVNLARVTSLLFCLSFCASLRTLSRGACSVGGVSPDPPPRLPFRPFQGRATRSGDRGGGSGLDLAAEVPVLREDAAPTGSAAPAQTAERPPKQPPTLHGQGVAPFPAT
jgi:hypothetical protein